MVNVSASKTGRGVVIREWLPFLEDQFSILKKQEKGEEGESSLRGAEGLLFLVIANLLKEEESGLTVWDSVPSLREYVLDLCLYLFSLLSLFLFLTFSTQCKILKKEEIFTNLDNLSLSFFS